jgi:cytochrome bd-type quinol oxidase subunit 2
MRHPDLIDCIADPCRHAAAKFGTAASAETYVIATSRVMSQWLGRPSIFAFPKIGILASVGAARSARRRNDRMPSIMVVVISAATFRTLALSFRPYKTPFSAAIKEAAASHSSLAFTFWFVDIIVFPLMLIYTAASYAMFRVRIRLSRAHRQGLSAVQSGDRSPGRFPRPMPDLATIVDEGAVCAAIGEQ